MTNPSNLSGTLSTAVLKTNAAGPVLGIDMPEIDGIPAGDFKMSYWGADPGQCTDWDQHDVVELWFVAEGRGEVWREGESTEVASGDVVFMPSRVRHRLHNTGGVTMRLFSVWWTAAAAAS